MLFSCTATLTAGLAAPLTTNLPAALVTTTTALAIRLDEPPKTAGGY